MIRINQALAIDHQNLYCRAVAALLISVTLAFAVRAQSATDGMTPVGLSPGAPAGSYPLSGFDAINFFNGNLNFTLPEIQIAGRGHTNYTIPLRLERKWRVIHRPYKPYPAASWWQVGPIGYGPGRLEGRLAGLPDVYDCGWGGLTLLRLTFTAPDGTEFEMRDKLTGGAPGWTELDPNSCQAQTTPNRGRVFVTADGTSASFVSDVDITDTNGQGGLPSGYLMLGNGTRYRIEVGKVMWMRDRNGNLMTFSYSGSLVTQIKDSLNRVVTFTYHNPNFSTPDEITYKGFSGATRTIRVYYGTLSQALRSGYSIQTYKQLFPELSGSFTSQYNPAVVTSVQLPDGRQYQFKYNPYGELARVELPTGGAVEYDWEGGLSGGNASGVQGLEIYRRVVERRIYPSGGSGSGFTSRMTVSKPEDAYYNNLGYVTVEQRDSAGTLLSSELHYYYGRASFVNDDPTEYSYWKDGKEWKTEGFDIVSGAPVLKRRVQHTWQQPVSGASWPLTQPETSDYAKSNNPQITETVTTLVDTNQVAKQTFSYDQYLNRTDVYEYDFGTGAVGSFGRRTHLDYLTTNPVNSADYASPNATASSIHIRNLPTQQWVSSDTGGSNKKSLTIFEYDNYTSDSLHAPLWARSGISGLDSAFTTSYTTRGNVTATTGYANAASSTGPVTGSSQYDVAGNVVKAIDGRGNPTNISYDDCFGAPDGNAAINSAPLELSSAGQTSFAFATAVTNAANQTVNSQFDYYLGRPVDGKDANGIVASGYYESAPNTLDRPTKVIRAVGVSGVQNQGNKPVGR